jgi:polysaccharide biosynthesis transport protein
MTEMLDEPKSEGFDLQRLMGIARRRHMQFLLFFFVGWLLVWAASWILPPHYKSTTLILVEQPTMPRDYVVPNISDDLQTRLQSMTEQILSRTRLLTIIQRLHLYNDPQGKFSDDDKIASMRKDIGVELVRNSPGQPITAFKISYTAHNPRLAQAVTTELTSLFITENLKVRREESEDTTEFLEKQLEDARQSLAQQEAKVQAFESQHEGTLPTQDAGNLQILSGLQAQLQGEQDALNTAKQQRVYLEALLQQEKAAQAKVRPSGSAGDTTGITDLASVDNQLDKLRQQLTELSAKYTDQYPDVQRLKDQIARMEAIRDNLIAASKKSAAAKPDSGTTAADSVADPDLSPTVRQLQSQLQANQVEISNRENSITSLNDRINEYRGRLNLEPSTEQELADLTRGYDQSKANYDDLLKKKEGSEMATSMEEVQQGQRFTMLDPPSLPTKPDFPNRLQFTGIGLGVGLALGLLVVGGLEFMDDRLYREKEIKELLPVQVISEIPEIVNPADEQKAKKSLAYAWAAGAVVLVTIAAGSLFSFLHS